MTAKTMMTRDPVTCSPSLRLEEALLLMHRHQVQSLPVVDDSGKLVGLLSLRGLVRALLPVAAQLGDAGLLDLSYLPDDTAALRGRFKELSGRAVEDFMHPLGETVVCKPDTSVPELLYLLSRSDWNPPMLSVIGEGGELLGVVTEWDILNNLANGLLDSTPGKRGEQH